MGEAEGLNQREEVELISQLSKETCLLSSPSMMRECPSYVRLRLRGSTVLSLLFESLSMARTVNTMPALPIMLLLGDITGKSPVPPEHRGYVGLMIDDWLAFGKAHALFK